MPPTFDEYLDRYAEVILKIGLRLQPGQRLLIGWPASGLYGVPLELAPLVRKITVQAYDMGAKLVDVLWNDDQMRLIRFQHAAPETLEEFPEWRSYAAIEAAKAADAVLRISAQDPGLLVDQDPDLISRFNAANARHIAPFSQLLTRSMMNWCVVTAPVDGWAEQLFPGLPSEEAKAAFWDALFDICRVKEPDPIAAWKVHIQQLKARNAYLNAKLYDSLHLVGPGTDLNVGLPKNHIWSGASMETQGGIEFTANIPTEEVFTTTHKDRTEGVVRTTKPFTYGGQVVKGLNLTFSEGRVTQLSAEQGESYFNKILDFDEGARRLGEVALVPHSSPISQANRLFYSTLVDENAACHIAVGRGFRFALQGGAKMSDEEYAAAGGNSSLIHIDVMVGSGEIDVDGISADGAVEPLMRNGEWAFDA